MFQIIKKKTQTLITVDSYDSGGEIELFDFQGLGCTIVVRISVCFVTSRISTFRLYSISLDLVGPVYGRQGSYRRTLQHIVGCFIE